MNPIRKLWKWCNRNKPQAIEGYPEDLKVKQRKAMRSNKLDFLPIGYQKEIMKMHIDGKPTKQIQKKLWTKYRVNVSESSIRRWFTEKQV